MVASSVAECPILRLGHCDIDLWPNSKKNIRNGLSSVGLNSILFIYIHTIFNNSHN